MQLAESAVSTGLWPWHLATICAVSVLSCCTGHGEWVKVLEYVHGTKSDGVGLVVGARKPVLVTPFCVVVTAACVVVTAASVVVTAASVVVATASHAEVQMESSLQYASPELHQPHFDRQCEWTVAPLQSLHGAPEQGPAPTAVGTRRAKQNAKSGNTQRDMVKLKMQ